MTVFDDLDREAFSAVEDTFAEPAMLVPRIGRISEPRPDPDRTQVEIRAIYSEAPDDPALFESRKSGATELGLTTILATKARLTIGAAQAALVPWLPRPMDAVLLISRPGAPVYAISRVDVDAAQVVTLYLTRETGL